MKARAARWAIGESILWPMVLLTAKKVDLYHPYQTPLSNRALDPRIADWQHGLVDGREIYHAELFCG